MKANRYKLFAIVLISGIALLGFAYYLYSYGYYAEYLKSKDPRLINNQQSYFVLNAQDSLKVKYLKEIDVRPQKFPYGEIFCTPQRLNAITKQITKKSYDNVIDLGLFIEKNNDSLTNWVSYADEVKNIGVYYIKNDSIKYDYYDVVSKTTQTFGNLSDSYCDAFIPFLFHNSNVKRQPSYISIGVRLKDMKNAYKKLTLAPKTEDVLYKKMRAY